MSPEGSTEKLEVQKQLVDIMSYRLHIDNSIELIGRLLFGSEKGLKMLKIVQPSGQPLVDDWDCLKSMVCLRRSSLLILQFSSFCISIHTINEIYNSQIQLFQFWLNYTFYSEPKARKPKKLNEMQEKHTLNFQLILFMSIEFWVSFLQVRTFETHCGSLSQYGMKHMRAFANICNAGIRTETMTEVAAQACIAFLDNPWSSIHRGFSAWHRIKTLFSSHKYDAE